MSEPSAASNEFQDAVCFAGAGTSVDCELCGRVHFSCGPQSGDWEPGELEKLESQAAAEPAKYIAHPEDDSIGWGVIDGKQVVYGCPCNKLVRYESWIWDHRELIVRYLKTRTLRDLKTGRRETERAEELNVLDPLVATNPLARNEE